ncbi:MAG: type II toxin-antitoxin system RelE/ParE family toxin [Bacteroidota bacterium]|nr:type II toxin-antitoxin system RelE/ParE family toxin [Bacteroidota bacterium]
MNKTAYILSDGALEDAGQIVAWYELQKDGLGQMFVSSLFKALEKIAASPLSFSKVSGKKHIRKYVLKDFPFKVYYDAEKTPIRIIALIHTSRSTNYIKRRLK